MQTAMIAGRDREILVSRTDPPARDSGLYLHATDRVRADGRPETVISGVDIVLKDGASNGVFRRLNRPRTAKLNPDRPKEKRRSVIIAADTVTLHGELSLPETDVTIFARRLAIRDGGRINTSPLAWDADKAPDGDPVSRKKASNGADGPTAGAIALFVHVLDAPTAEPTFLAIGAPGQAAGHGFNGLKGDSMSTVSNIFSLNDSGHVNKATAKYEHPCVYADYYWKWGFIQQVHKQRGANKWPTNGQDAVEPGAPGSGGDGGAFTTNTAAAKALLANDGGRAGAKAVNVRGGRAGQPTKCAHYQVTNQFNLLSATAASHVKSINGGPKSTKAGASYTAKPSARGDGKPGAVTLLDAPAAWTHPLQVGAVLRYARDAVLAGERDAVAEMLRPYMDALSQPMPTEAEAWDADAAAGWAPAQSNAAALLTRLNTELDAFGNPFGFMPFLSLASTVRLHDQGADRALKMLLLSAWVGDAERNAESAANAMASAIEDTLADTDRVVDALQKAEARVDALDQDLMALEEQLRRMGHKLDALRTKLFNQASEDLHIRAQIKFAVKMASAIAQVIPYVQPAAGALGDLASMAADMSDSDADIPDTVSKMGDTIDKARKAYKKAQAAKKKAAEAAKKAKSEKPNASTGSASLAAKGWADVADGIGPAVSHAGEAFKALQVSDAEIEGELAKLADSSPEWTEITDELRALNVDKARIFGNLCTLLNEIAESYGRLADNADAVRLLQAAKEAKVAALSPEANAVVQRMAQDARMALQYRLYLMTKAYETTVFKSLTVDWSLDAVFDKLLALLGGRDTLDAAGLTEMATALKPLFEQTVDALRDRLLEDFDFNNTLVAPLEFGMTDAQTPEMLDRLNRGTPVAVNPLNVGLVLPQQQRARAVSFECTKLEFDPEGPALPASGNMIVTLRPGIEGTVRKDEHLYLVRTDRPRQWGWTFNFSSGTLGANPPSLAALDLLNLLLGPAHDDVKQKLAAPPAWTDNAIGVSFSPPLPPGQRPRIKELIFRCMVESLPAPQSQCVLDIRGVGPESEIAVAPADLARRTAGMGATYRIFSKGQHVTLTAPDCQGDDHFHEWSLLGRDMIRSEDPETQVVLADNMLALAHYAAPTIETGILAKYSQVAPAARMADIGDAIQAEALTTLLATTGAAANAPADRATAPKPAMLRAAPEASAAVIALIPPDARATTLEDAGAGWRKAQYGAAIGFVQV